MKKYTKILLFISLFPGFLLQGIYIADAQTTNRNWTVSKPFQRDVFIENKGQFPAEETKAVGSPICYFTIKGKMFLYFTPSGLVMRYDSVYKLSNETEKDDGQEDELKNLRVRHLFTKMQWLGCNTHAQIEVENETPDYFTYPNALAHAWTKLTYKNLYNGIDVEFYYPEKGGIEYNIIVHPGADLSQVKILYSGSMLSRRGNDLVIHTVWGVFIDHAPYAQVEGAETSCVASLNGNTISFNAGSYDKNKTLTIDPWITATNLGGSNKAYDLGYDYLGNVYVYGGGAANYYELQKYNSSGSLQWTYTNTNFTYYYISGYFYGGMCTDHITGTSYMCEGYDPSGGTKVVKVNYNGALAATYPGNNTYESWKIGYDYCNNQLILAQGSNEKAARLDTNLTSMTNVNILNNASAQDQTLLGFDNVGNCYIATCRMVYVSCCSNELCKMPLPTLGPTSWIIADHHNFEEITNISYYPPISPYVAGNGFNGCAATPTFVLTYDGGRLRKWTASNGIIMDSAIVSNTLNAWGGLDIGCDGHVYCGNNQEVSIYDSDMNSLGNISLNNTVYALAAAPNGDIYAAGNGFVQSVDGGSKVLTVTSTPAGCACTGTATAHICGEGSYSFSWSNGATTSSISNACSGTYTVTAISSNCLNVKDTAIVDLGSGNSIITNMDTVNPTCIANGYVTVNPVGGHSPYTYQWSNGGTTTSDTGLVAGNYYLLITDSTGCSDTIHFTLIAPSLPHDTVTTANILCNGGTGSANAVVTGGTSPFTYFWAPGGQSTASATGLLAGTYSVTVTDKNGCTVTSSITLTQPPVLIAVVDTFTNASDCINNGTATVVDSGGTPNYRYNWAPSGGTNALGTGLSGGTYTVTVTDANSCTASAAVTITQPSQLSVVSNQLSVSCHNGSNGSASVSVSGGISPYTYLWSPGNQTTSAVTGLTAGTYTVVITDNNSCTGASIITISQPAQLNATIDNIRNLLCNGGSSGSANMSVNGGTSPYTYLWTPGNQTASSATGLTAGTYTVLVTDNNSCTSSASFALTQPSALAANILLTANVLCNGNSLGSAQASPTGGVSPYSYLWQGGATTSSVSGLSAGTYTLMLTDNNSCTINTGLTVSQPAVLSANASVSANVLCFGSNSGSAQSSPTGGTAPYTYSWQGGGTSTSISGLSAGTYSVTVTDNYGCTNSAKVTITQPPQLSVASSQLPVSCNGGSDGSATLTASGGVSPYTYLWQPGNQTTSTATGLTAGTYTITITDNNNCTTTDNITITQPNQLTAVGYQLSAITCFGGSNGSASVSVSGGTSPYTYSWSDGSTTLIASGLSAGTYTITLTDNNSCTASASAVVTQPNQMSIVSSQLPVSCNGGSSGSASVSVSGGTAPYTYLWSGGGSNSNKTGLSAGTYTVSVTDNISCTASASVTVSQPPQLSAVGSQLSAVSCNGRNDGSATLSVSGGTSPYTYSWSNGSTALTASGLTAGTYTVTVTDNNSCTATASATVSQTAVLIATANIISNDACYSGNNGSASVSVSGGTPAYHYRWSPVNQTTSAAFGLTAGVYTIIVTDNNSCTTSATATITQPTQLTLTLTAPPILCKGQQGTLTATPSGGVPPYNYSWSTGSLTTSATVTPLVPTTYTCTVTDNNGCIVSSTIAIGNFGPPLTVNITGPTSLCIGNTMHLCAAISGGSGGNTLTWQPGNYNTACITVSPTATTVYTLTLTDNCGDDDTVTKTVWVNPLPTVNFSSNPASGCSPLCINFTDLSTSLVGRITSRHWLFGNGDSSNSQNPNYCYPNSGNYSVTLNATTDSGCSATLDKLNLITVYSHPVADFTMAPQPATMLNPTIQFTNLSTDQYGIAYWFWTFGDNSDSASNLKNPIHTYTDTGLFCPQLIAINTHGCMDTATNCLDISPFYSFYIPSAFTPNGEGLNEIFIPKGEYIKSFEMYIFNRWGMQLFHSTSINNGWNGSINNTGQICQQDVYVYQIYVTDSQNNNHSYTGEVTLLK